MSPEELDRRLRHEGLGLRTGAFVAAVRTDVSDIVAALGSLYGPYPVAGADDIVDMEVAVRRRRSHPAGRVRIVAELGGIEPFPPAPPHQAVQVFETALNYGLATLDLDTLIVHAGVVERGSRAILLPGDSGSGKSTLSAALDFRGWRLLSDEMAIIGVGDGLLRPVVRPVSLKNQSIDAIRSFEPDAVLSRRYEGTTKGTIAYCRPAPDSLERGGEPAAPAWVVLPRFDRAAATALTPMNRKDAFVRLMGHAVNYRRLARAGFETMADLVERCPAYDLRFRDLDEAVACVETLTAQT